MIARAAILGIPFWADPELIAGSEISTTSSESESNSDQFNLFIKEKKCLVPKIFVKTFIFIDDALCKCNLCLLVIKLF
jgi:hypothetical protein